MKETIIGLQGKEQKEEIIETAPLQIADISSLVRLEKEIYSDNPTLIFGQQHFESILNLPSTASLSFKAIYKQVVLGYILAHFETYDRHDEIVNIGEKCVRIDDFAVKNHKTALGARMSVLLANSFIERYINYSELHGVFPPIIAITRDSTSRRFLPKLIEKAGEGVKIPFRIIETDAVVKRDELLYYTVVLPNLSSEKED